MGSTQKHYLKINPYLDIISGITVVLSFSDGIIKIIGREGSGKSVLTQLLAAELMEEDQEVVIFSDIPHSEPELHDPIQQQLHLDLGSNSDFYTALNLHIQARPYDQQKLILVFDDADQIPDDCFEAIRVLFEKNYHDRPEVSMVFAGTEMLDDKLNEPANRTFNKNIILNFEVKPMNRSELEAFVNAYLVEMGLQKHHLSKEDLDDIFAETKGLPGKIPELIFAIIDREKEQNKSGTDTKPEGKGIISKLVELDDDPEPELTGLSVEDREEVLTAYKDQVPWRWQSNGVGIAVVVLFVIVGYGHFVPAEDRVSSIVVVPPPSRSPGQATPVELADLALLPSPLDPTQSTAVPGEDAGESVIAEDDAQTPAADIEPENVAGPELAGAEIVEPEIVESEVEPDSAVAESAAPEPALAADTTTGEPAAVGESEPAPAAAPQPATGPVAFVSSWLNAWENQEPVTYLQAYHSEFNPPAGQSLQAWQSERTTRINRPATIMIDTENLEVIEQSASQASVELQFTYTTENYADRTVKELVLAIENGNWAILEERNLSVERLPVSGAPTSESPALLTLDPPDVDEGESRFAAKIQQVLNLAMPDETALNTPFGMFISDWLGAWKSQDVEGYFRHYHDNFTPAYFDSMSDWRADRIRKINEKRFIDIAFDDIEILDEDENSTRIRFWLSYVSSFYLDRTLKEVVLIEQEGNRGLEILQERNLEIEIIPFYP